MDVSKQDIQDRIIELLRHRAKTSSICPSDAARALSGDVDGWRALMPAVRREAARLAHEGVVLITQGDVTLDPANIDHGPIRLRRGPKFSD